MTQRDLFNEGEFDAYLDTLVTVCLAAASPLAGHEQGPRYLEAPDAPGPASLDEAESDGVPVRDADYYEFDDEERYGELPERIDPQTGFVD